MGRVYIQKSCLLMAYLRDGPVACVADNFSVIVKVN